MAKYTYNVASAVVNNRCRAADSNRAHRRFGREINFGSEMKGPATSIKGECRIETDESREYRTLAQPMDTDPRRRRDGNTMAGHAGLPGRQSKNFKSNGPAAGLPWREF